MEDYDHGLETLFTGGDHDLSGIQHNSEKERRTIFSIWDTTPELHPKVTAADPKTIFDRFGGEGTGAHTYLLWPWKVGDTFQFFVHKQPGQKPDPRSRRPTWKSPGATPR